MGEVWARRATVLALGLVMLGTAWSDEAAYKAHEVWVAADTGGKAGAGTFTDPFDASSAEKLNALFTKFKDKYGDNLTMHFGPGVFFGDKNWSPASNWKIRGAGMDITVFKSKPDPNGIGTVGFREGGYEGGPSGFELSDCTFDFNTAALRHANRAFVFLEGNRGQVSYFYAQNLPQWAADRQYAHGEAVAYQGAEYMALMPSKGQAPAQGLLWSPLRPNHPGGLPAWKAEQTYRPGDAVVEGGAAYLRLAAETKGAPVTDKTRWQKLDPDAPDPMIYTHAAFMHARPPGGRHRVSRVRAINGNGSAFFGREDFIIGLGGDDCVIEDCVVEQFHGDYASLIVTTFGQHGVIRGCTVRGNDGLATMAYGAWACWDTVFENNFCTNVRCATNIDSLTCRNVTFRNNVFMNCREVGILVNVGGGVVGGCENVATVVDGKPINVSRSQMDGLFIYGNLVEMRDGAPYGGIQAQQDGLTNVHIANNVIRTTSGAGKARALGVLGPGHATVCNNTCEPGMYAEMPPQAVCRDNYDLLGQPMKDAQGKPIDGKPGH